MLLLSLFIAAATLAAETGTLECKAIYRSTDKAGRVTENILEMPITYTGGGLAKYEVALEGRFFSMMEDKNGTLLAQITQGPDYTKGILGRGEVDSSGRFNLSDVNGYILYRMECKKLPQANPPRLGL